MRNLFFFLFSVIAFVFLACDKDDPCDPGQLETNIIGQWNVGGILPVEFKANGDFVDVSGAFVPDSIAGFTVTHKGYAVPNNDTIRLIASNSLTSVSYPFAVVSYTCDEIKVSDAGGTYTLIRKD